MNRRSAVSALFSIMVAAAAAASPGAYGYDPEGRAFRLALGTGPVSLVHQDFDLSRHDTGSGSTVAESESLSYDGSAFSVPASLEWCNGDLLVALAGVWVDGSGVSSTTRGRPASWDSMQRTLDIRASLDLVALRRTGIVLTLGGTAQLWSFTETNQTTCNGRFDPGGDRTTQMTRFGRLGVGSRLRAWTDRTTCFRAAIELLPWGYGSSRVTSTCPGSHPIPFQESGFPAEARMEIGFAVRAGRNVGISFDMVGSFRSISLKNEGPQVRTDLRERAFDTSVFPRISAEVYL